MTRVQRNIPKVNVDRIQLQQVLVNLMRNALEAMQKGGGRELLLTAASCDSGTAVEFSLQDSGSGLTKASADHLFQPFVSDKEDGMGVGLWICQTIVTDHGGRIWAHAAPTGGTTFFFTLPAAIAA